MITRGIRPELKAGPDEDRLTVSLIGPNGETIRRVRVKRDARVSMPVPPKHSMTATARNADGELVYKKRHVKAGERVVVPELATPKRRKAGESTDDYRPSKRKSRPSGIGAFAGSLPTPKLPHAARRDFRGKPADLRGRRAIELPKRSARSLLS